jgi:hypothetical protein
MSRLDCRAPIELPALLAYWLGELDAASEGRAEQHLLGCAACSRRLEELAALADGVRALTREGAVHAVVSDVFVRRLVERGVRVREYRVPCNGSVNCTVAPEDEVVISRLEVPLGGIQRLDMVEIDPEGRGQARLEDVPFSVGSDGVAITQSVDRLRALPASTTRVRLLAVDERGERVIGEYTFNHTPHATRR